MKTNWTVQVIRFVLLRKPCSRLRNPLATAAAAAAVLAGMGCNGPSSPSEVRASAIYATAGQGSQLVRIDPATGTGTVIGALNATGAFAMARRSDGVLFTITNSGFTPNPDARAAIVDPRTGSVNVFGEAFGEYLRMMGLAFGRDGTLYGSSPITQSLYRIDLATGRPIRIGPFGVNGVMDLAVDASGELWANTQTALYRVDPATGAATLAARFSGASAIMGIAFDGAGQLFTTSFEAESKLYRVDHVTGAASMVGTTGLHHVHSAEFGPVG